MIDEPAHFVAGPCLLCGRVFTFNPALVPSVYVDPRTGIPPDVGGTPVEESVRKPLCTECVEFVNERRRAFGREPIPILAGAYEIARGLPE